MRALKAEDIETYAEDFRTCESNEPLNQVKGLLRELAAAARTDIPCDTRIAFDGNEKPLGLFSSRTTADRIELPLFRIGRKHPLGSTFGKHVLLQAVAEAARLGIHEVRVMDPSLSSQVDGLAAELQFASVPDSRHRSRPIVRFVGVLSGALAPLGRAGVMIDPAAKMTAAMAAEIEGRLWPLKILGQGIVPFVVPIKANWARALFDDDLASTELYPTPASIALNRENIYYRSARPGGPIAPGRVLWYVSEDRHAAGSKAIRACSRLLRVETGPAKKLYRAYEHLGIYTWKEVMKTAKGNLNGEIMVLLFSDTEPFRKPVPLAFLREIGAGKRLVSPTAVSDDQFERIYHYGMNQSS